MRTAWPASIPRAFSSGEQPANLPVQQATNVELYINLGITIPLPLSGPADELIE